jgi:formylglycine-generating enzyme required for sulfatase activity
MTAEAGPLMAAIPPGWFSMGSDEGRDNERPVHRVYVDAFELAIHQVTNADYLRFVRATGHPMPPHAREPGFDDPLMPVVAVSWIEAAAYCAWLSEASGPRYRLPTEAEWERAARGGEEGRRYPWGDAPPESLPDYGTRFRGGPERVGLYAASAYGLHNMGDNVHEWCSDWYDPAYYARSPERNPRGAEAGERRASRGGSWRHHVKVSTCAARSSLPPDSRYSDYGFRIARDSL